MRPAPPLVASLLRLRLRLLVILILGSVAAAADPPQEHGHATAHGGCLNAIGTCENGHAEAKLEGTTLQLWFVGGGTMTTSAVRVPDAAIVLVADDTAGGPVRRITLAAAPLVLAEEKAGDCSHFVGEAAWLAGLTTLHATGTVTFHGKPAKLIIDWPQGFDPDDLPARTVPAAPR